MLRGAAGVIVMMLGAGVSAGQTTVTLRPSAAVSAGDPVTIGSVAGVSGRGSAVIAALKLADDARALDVGRAGWAVVEMDDVRSALEAAGLMSSGIALSGAACELRVVAARAEPIKSDASDEKPRREPAHVSLEGPATVRTLVVARIGLLLGLGPNDLRFGFRLQDEGLLSQRIEGRRVDVQPAGTSGSGRVPVRVVAYEGERLTLNETVLVDVLARRVVASPREAVRKGQALTESMLNVAERWLAPDAGVPIDPAEAVGSVARGRLLPGQVLTRSDVEAPIVVRRGDEVWVHALSGSVTVKVKARALGSALDGELVELRVQGSDTSFTARMSGRGTAVMVLDAPPSPPTPPPSPAE